MLLWIQLIIILAIFDLLFIGLISYTLAKLGIVKTIIPVKKDDLKNKIIEDSLLTWHQTSSLKTNIDNCIIDPSKTRFTMKSIMLTNSQLIVRTTKLTYMLTIDKSSMVGYTVKPKLFSSEFTINLIIEGKSRYFQFRTKHADEWIKSFSKIGVYQRKTRA